MKARSSEWAESRVGMASVGHEVGDFTNTLYYEMDGILQTVESRFVSSRIGFHISAADLAEP
ncbi:MAG: hypothetical protein P1U82_12125 [Verrucomicrobiales bacterium]|nr:hypothetical protein [Verrucomicrobiales bacterium]